MLATIVTVSSALVSAQRLETFGLDSSPLRRGLAAREAEAASSRSHASVASRQAPQMPEPPADPLQWSIDEVKAANFLNSAAYASSLCGALEAGQTGDALSDRLHAMLSHADGVRGFFVTYLTDPTLESIADAPNGLSPLVVSELRRSNPAMVAPLAVMNVMMPSATALAHEASGNAAAAAGSLLTQARAARVLEALLSDPEAGPPTRSKLEAARAGAERFSAAAAIDSGDEWDAFFRRWSYDATQMAAVREALDEVLSTSPA